MAYLAKKYKLSAGTGVSDKKLPSFDKALLRAGVGNYNLVRLSSILPAHCESVSEIDIPEGSLLPVAYSTISSDHVGDLLCSTIGVGLPVNEDKVGVIMEYSDINRSEEECIATLEQMIHEAFEERGWALADIQWIAVSREVRNPIMHTTFACIAEW